MKDDRVRLDGRGRAPVLPSRTQEHQRRVAAVHVHGDGTATTRPNDYVRLMLLVFGLSNSDRLFEVFIGQCRIDDFVSGVFEVCRFEAAYDLRRCASRGERGFSFSLPRLACIAFLTARVHKRSNDWQARRRLVRFRKVNCSSQTGPNWRGGQQW